MTDWKAVSFGVGLLLFGLFALLLPLSPALQTLPLSTEPMSKYVQALQASGAIAIPSAIILFYLAYKNKVF